MVVLVRLGVLEDQEVALDAVADALSRESVLHDAKSSSSVSGGICADISACLFEEAWRRWKLSEIAEMLSVAKFVHASLAYSHS